MSPQSQRSKYNRGDSIVSKRRDLTDEDKRDIWGLFETSYYKDSLYVFKMVRRQRELVFEGFCDT